MKVIASLAALGSLAVLVSGCGGGGLSEGGCSNGATCGGDLVGTWTIVSSCLSISATGFDMDCPTATVTSSKQTITGTQTYNADLTYTVVETLSVNATVTLPMSCVTFQGFALTCAQVTQLLMADGSFKSATCTSAGTGCSCNVVVSEVGASGAGIYSTSNGVVTTTTDDGSTEQNSYCVRGKTLTQSPLAGSFTMGASATGTITSTK
jgi:hypothetical protein